MINLLIYIFLVFFIDFFNYYYFVSFDIKKK